jgi:hypothetical protein
MSKIVKLKLTDIENIVRKTINENEMMEDDMEMGDNPKRNIQIMKDENGRHYVVDTDTDEILGVK